MCNKPARRGNALGAAPGSADLQHLPTPLLSHIFLQLDWGTRPAWSACCRALRVAALHSLGRAMVRCGSGGPGHVAVTALHLLSEL